MKAKIELIYNGLWELKVLKTNWTIYVQIVSGNQKNGPNYRKNLKNEELLLVINKICINYLKVIELYIFTKLPKINMIP